MVNIFILTSGFSEFDLLVVDITALAVGTILRKSFWILDHIPNRLCEAYKGGLTQQFCLLLNFLRSFQLLGKTDFVFNASPKH